MLKSAYLLHKCGLGDSDMSSTVFVVLGANFQGLKSTLSSQNLFSNWNIELGKQPLLMTLLISFISKHGLFSKKLPNF